MADVIDIINTMVNKLDNLFYPNGDSNLSINGDLFRIEPGWPNQQTLNTALANNVTTVIVYPLEGERNINKYSPNDEVLPQLPIGLQANVNSNIITLSGQVNLGDVIGVSIGNNNYGFTPNINMTLTQVASGLASIIPQTTSLNNTITLPANGQVVLAKNGTSYKTIGTTQRRIQIIVMAATPALRDRTAILITGALSAIDFLPVDVGQPFPEQCRMMYAGASWSDKAENANLYRRSIDYTVEYNTNIYTTAYAVLFPKVVSH